MLPDFNIHKIKFEYEVSAKGKSFGLVDWGWRGILYIGHGLECKIYTVDSTDEEKKLTKRAKCCANSAL